MPADLATCGDDAPLSMLRPARELSPECSVELDGNNEDDVAVVTVGTENEEPAIAAGTNCGDARFDVDASGCKAI